MDRKIITKGIFVLILIIGAVLRLSFLAKSPPSLNWDEAALGYSAYSILKTRKDEFGIKLPIFLRSFDDYKPAIYSYTAIPFIKLLGLNETAVRLPSAIAGIISILFVYLISKELFNSKVGLIASALVAIEPWSVHFSRAAFETNLALSFYLGGIYFILRSKFKNWMGFAGIFFLVLSSYTYQTEKILIIPTLLILALSFRKNFRWIHVIQAIFLLLPLIYNHIAVKESFSRLGSTIYLQGILPRMISYFSPVNLFVRGTPEPTQQIFGFGMFHLIEFFFWIYGFYFLLKNYREHKLFLLLILISPIPAIITWNWFYPARVLPLFAFFSIVIAQGVLEASKKLPKIILLPILLLFIPSVFNLATNLLFYLPYREKGSWQYGMKQIVEKINERETNYKNIVFETRTAQPHIFILFYSKYDPAKYQEETKFLANEKPRRNFNFGKYTFRDVYWNTDQYLKEALLIAPESSLPSGKVRSNPNTNFFSEVNDSWANPLSNIVGLK